MPGRPNTQKPGWLLWPIAYEWWRMLPLHWKTHPWDLFLVSSSIKEMCPEVFDPESGVVPMKNSSLRSSSLSKMMDEGKVNRLWKGPLFLPHALPLGRPYITTHSMWTTCSIVQTLAISSTIKSWFVAISQMSQEDMPQAFHWNMDVPLNLWEFVPRHII